MKNSLQDNTIDDTLENMERYEKRKDAITQDNHSLKMPDFNMPIVNHQPSLFYNHQFMKILTIFIGLFNFASIMIAVFMFIRGKLDSSDNDMYIAANYCAILGCVDIFISIVILCRNKLFQNIIFRKSFHLNGKYHLALCTMASINFILHGVLMMSLNQTSFTTDLTSKDTSGLNIWLTVWVMMAFSSPKVKEISYFLFHFFHWFFILWLMIFGSMHSPTVLAPIFATSIFIYLIDFLWIKYNCKKKNEMTVKSMKIMPGNMTKLVLNKPENFKFEAGQHSYLSWSGYSKSHPFSFSSAPYQEDLVFYIRSRGFWTKNLYNIAKQYKKSKIKDFYFPSIFLEGPYGNVSERPVEEYKHLIFVSGGMGVTSNQSLFNHYLQKKLQTNTCDTINSIDFIWCVRENEEICNTWSQQKCDLDQILYTHFQPNAIDSELIEKVKKSNPKAIINIHFHLTSTYIVRLKTFQDQLKKEPNLKVPLKPSYIDLFTRPMELEFIIKQKVEQVAMHRDTWLGIYCCAPQQLQDKIVRLAETNSQNDCKIETHLQSFA